MTEQISKYLRFCVLSVRHPIQVSREWRRITRENRQALHDAIVASCQTHFDDDWWEDGTALPDEPCCYFVDGSACSRSDCPAWGPDA